MRGRVLVLAKAPVPGLVKTRLCPPCTPAQAAGIAAASLADTLDAAHAQAAHAAAGPPVLALADGWPGTPDAAADRAGDGAFGPAGWPGLAVPTGTVVLPQRGRGLGERIAAAFADAGGPLLQIGMDTPQVDAALLTACLSTLDGADAVLGPAEDGGWWALGLHDPRYARLVAAVPMSTMDTGRLTLAALRDAGLRVVLLPTLRDVDTWPDAVAVAGLVPGGRFAAAVSAAA